jgi:type 1 fimbriae regulatory protein FimB
MSDHPYHNTEVPADVDAVCVGSCAVVLRKIPQIGSTSDLVARKTATLRLVSESAPNTVFGSTWKRSPKHRRKFLTEVEVEALVRAATNHRDRTMIRTAFIHGLRAKELVKLTWGQVDLAAGLMSIYRSKHGRDATHPIPGQEIRDLRRLWREAKNPGPDSFVFVSRLGAPMTTRAFGQMLDRVSASIGMANVHPHALRHAAGYKLALKGTAMRTIQHYLGHRRIASTEIYTEHAPTDFRGLFE